MLGPSLCMKKNESTPHGIWTDVTLMYKVTVANCLITVPVNYHPATVRSTRRSHSIKFSTNPWHSVEEPHNNPRYYARSLVNLDKCC